jgi:hypothetical protein
MHTYSDVCEYMAMTLLFANNEAWEPTFLYNRIQKFIRSSHSSSFNYTIKDVFIKKKRHNRAPHNL